MKTKEEIILKIANAPDGTKLNKLSIISTETALKAMDEYANHQCEKQRKICANVFWNTDIINSTSIFDAIANAEPPK